MMSGGDNSKKEEKSKPKEEEPKKINNFSEKIKNIEQPKKEEIKKEGLIF